MGNLHCVHYIWTTSCFHPYKHRPSVMQERYFFMYLWATKDWYKRQRVSTLVPSFTKPYKYPPVGYLFGDGDFPCLKTRLAFYYHANTLCQIQEIFNLHHSMAHSVEWAVGMMKTCLQATLSMALEVHSAFVQSTSTCISTQSMLLFKKYSRGEVGPPASWTFHVGSPKRLQVNSKVLGSHL